MKLHNADVKDIINSSGNTACNKNEIVGKNFFYGDGYAGIKA